MRAVFSAFCVAGILAIVVSSTPLKRDKRFAGVYSAAGFNPFVGGAFAGGPFGGVFANPFFTGFNVPQVRRTPSFPVYPDYPAFPSVPFVFPFTPFQFPEIKNWYEGENVCKEEKVINSQAQDDAIPDDWKADMPNVNTDFSHEQESCKGTNNKYLCVKRVYGSNGEAKIQATKYECCHGFVRDPTGAPGCVESKQPSQGTNGKLTSNDPTYYVIQSGNSMKGSSSVSSASAGNIDKVPIQ